MSSSYAIDRLNRTLRHLVLLKALELDAQPEFDCGQDITARRILSSVIDKTLESISLDSLDGVYAGNYDSWPKKG
jgi:hypothetical protein